jgi:hypothetical protein
MYVVVFILDCTLVFFISSIFIYFLIYILIYLFLIYRYLYGTRYTKDTSIFCFSVFKNDHIIYITGTTWVVCSIDTELYMIL